MVSFLTVFTACTFTATVYASPVLVETSLIEKRDISGVKLCSEPQFQGACWSGVYPLNDCINLNSWTGKVGSFEPDDGTQCFVMQ